jgi:hypothetical protein
MQYLQWNLIHQLQGNVEEYIGLQPIPQHRLKFEVLLVHSEEFVVLVYHYQAHDNVTERKHTASKHCQKQGHYNCNLVEFHEGNCLEVLVNIVQHHMILDFIDFLSLLIRVGLQELVFMNLLAVLLEI